jgi:cytochrome c-type biogenesis protein CcsB
MRLKALIPAIVMLSGMCAWGQVQPPAGNDLPSDEPGTFAPQFPMGWPDDWPSRGTLRVKAAIEDQGKHDAFAEAVDVGPLRTAAVYNDARVKIVDTLARETLTAIYGKERFTDVESGASYDPVFTLLDLTFDHAYYLNKPLIYIENLEVRRAAVSNLPAEQQEKWLRWGRLTPQMLWSEPVVRSLSGMMSDVTTAKALGQVQGASDKFLAAAGGELLKLVGPAAGSDEWRTVAEYARDTDGDQAAQMSGTYKQLASAWRGGDAAKVNGLIVKLAGELPGVNEASYPAAWLRYAEWFYNVSGKFTYSYIAYFIAFVALMCGLATGRKWLLGTGATMFAIGFLGHTLGLATRMALAADWRIHNQFESFIMLSWFAVVVAIVLLMVKRQWLFATAASAIGAAALLVANTTPIPSEELGPVAGILQTSRILYIHVNTVVFSYALITLGCVMSLFYLGTYYFGGRVSMRLATAGLNETGELNVGDEAVRGRAAILSDLDKAQMVVLQLAFWLLGVGILLGAWWADHSWGRWWGWDPKETWALITWLVYLTVVHLRFVVKNRGLVTAWLSVLGFVTMLWTHWGVNLVLAGLHSYA